MEVWLLWHTHTVGEEDDEKREEERDEVGVGDEPAFVVDVFGMLFFAHALTSE